MVTVQRLGPSLTPFALGPLAPNKAPVFWPVRCNACSPRPTLPATYLSQAVTATIWPSARPGLAPKFLWPAGAGENMDLPESLAILAASLALLFFGRGRNGNAISIFQKFPWVVGQLFGMAILYLFAAGLMGVAANLNWLH